MSKWARDHRTCHATEGSSRQSTIRILQSAVLSDTKFILLQVSHICYTSLVVLLTLVIITSARSARADKGKFPTLQICTFYVRKPEYRDLDERKFPLFIVLVTILETLCSNAQNHLLVAYVLEGNVRFLLIKEGGYLSTYYDSATFAEGIQRWPHFSWYSLQRIACNFFIEAGLVFHPGRDELKRENKGPVATFCSIVKGVFYCIFWPLLNFF